MAKTKLDTPFKGAAPVKREPAKGSFTVGDGLPVVVGIKVAKERTDSFKR